MIIPFFLFVGLMAANSQYPPWGPPNPYAVTVEDPSYYVQPFSLFFGKGHKDHKHGHHVVHHKA